MLFFIESVKSFERRNEGFKRFNKKTYKEILQKHHALQVNEEQLIKSIQFNKCIKNYDQKLSYYYHNRNFIEPSKFTFHNIKYFVNTKNQKPELYPISYDFDRSGWVSNNSYLPECHDLVDFKFFERLLKTSYL